VAAQQRGPTKPPRLRPRLQEKQGEVMINKELLEILACPQCKGAVKLENEKIVCQNPQCGLRYPIKDGIPVMLVDQRSSFTV
jgi:uncharacterized protein YbaR (Trm112 family)